MKRKSRKKARSHPHRNQVEHRKLDHSSSDPSVQSLLKESRPSRPLIPGEFETQEYLVFGCGQLVRFYPQFFADFVRVSHERIRLIGIINPKWRKLADLLLGACGLPLDAVEYVEGVTNSVWARDWSPIFGYDASGNRCQFYLDRDHMRHRDDVVARHVFQKRFPGPVRDVPLTMEGGNFLSNGQGLILTSQTVTHQNQARYTQSQVTKLFSTHFGSDLWAGLTPLHAERTGHVDLFATFLRPDFLVIGQVDEREEPVSNRVLEDISEKLKSLQTPSGKLNIARIPMGSSRDSYFRSYNNVVFANQTLLVPTFPQSDPKLDRRVIDIFREYLTGWEIIGLNMGDLAYKGGGLHCLSVNVPPPQRTSLIQPELVTAP